MSFKKFIAVFTAFCFIWTFSAQTFAAGASASSLANMPADIFTNQIISSAFGSIIESSGFSSSQVVVNIQDLHSHPQAQKNIAQIIETLDDKYKVKAVYLEGASGKVDLSWLSKTQDKEIAKQTAEQLVLDGRLTGVEYYAFLNDKKNAFGLENENVHKENIERLGKIYENEAKYAKIIKDAEKEIRYLSNKFLTQQSKNYLALIDKYNGKKIKDYEFYKKLFKYVGQINADLQSYGVLLPIDINEYPELQTVILLNEASNKLQPKKVNTELSAFLNELKSSLNYREYSKILKDTDNFQDVDALCKYLSHYGIDKKKSPQLAAFVTLKELNAKINPVALFFQEQKLKEQILSALAVTFEENEISFLQSFFPFFKGYLTNELTAKDEQYFKENFKVFSDIYAKYVSVNQIKKIADDFEFLNDYYNVNNTRNEIFIENIKQNTPLIQGGARTKEGAAEILAKADEVIILVSGGYHAHGIAELLNEKKISNVVITPRISDGVESAQANYKQIIAEQSRFFNQALAFLIASQAVNTQKLSIAQAGVNILNKTNLSFDQKIERLFSYLKEFGLNFSFENDILTIDGGIELRLYNEDGKIAVRNARAQEEELQSAQEIEIETLSQSLIELAQDAKDIPALLQALINHKIADESVYNALKKFYNAQANAGTVYPDVNGALSGLEGKSVSGIKEGNIGKMPNWFQQEILDIEFPAQQQKDSKLTDAITDIVNFAQKKILTLFILLTMFINIAIAQNDNSGQKQQPGIENIISQKQDSAKAESAYEKFEAGDVLPGSFISLQDDINNAVQDDLLPQEMSAPKQKAAFMWFSAVMFFSLLFQRVKRGFRKSDETKRELSASEIIESEQVKELFQEHFSNLGGEIADVPKALSGGAREQKPYLITLTNGKKYVLKPIQRVVRNGEERDAGTLTAIINHLRANDIPAVKIYETDEKKFYFEQDGYIYMLMDYIEYKPFKSHEEYKDVHFQKTIELISDMQDAFEDMPDFKENQKKAERNNWDFETEIVVAAKMDLTDISAKIKKATGTDYDMGSLLNRIISVFDDLRINGNLWETFIHRDVRLANIIMMSGEFREGNVLFDENDNIAGLIDFDDTTYTYRLVELGLLIIPYLSLELDKMLKILKMF
ncbi:MAG: phosphotransferase, partial [Endomicrobium sp.]|nr:phosphotransferase [Endomicrobium sp.]